MGPLNDQELNSLLQDAKGRPPEPTAGFARRTLQAYRIATNEQSRRRQLFLQPVSIPWSLGLLSALLLLLVGAFGEYVWQTRSGVNDSQAFTMRTVTEHAGYQEIEDSRNSSQQRIHSLSFRDFRPVHQIRPRVVRDGQNDQ